MPTASFADLQETFGGQFVALCDGKVLAAAKTFSELLAAIERAGLGEPRLTFEHIEAPDAFRAY